MKPKTLLYILGTIFYVVLWLFNAFLVGMSHSVPYHKFDEPIYEYLFLIMIGELLFYVFIPHLYQHLRNGAGEWLSFSIGFILCVSFPWQVIQFTQYGYGYRWIEQTGMSEQLMVLIVNSLPLVLIMLTTAYRERIGNVLFGRLTGSSYREK